MLPSAKILRVGRSLLLAASCLGATAAVAAFRRSAPGQFPPLTRPLYERAAESTLDDSARVVAVEVGVDTRCYPLRLMSFHHVVNDWIGGRHLAVTYCAMTDSALTLELDRDDDALAAAGLDGGTLVLGPAGGGPGLWPQLQPDAPEEGGSMGMHPGPAPVLTTFGRFRRAHPRALVLAPVARFALHYEAHDAWRGSSEASPLELETRRGGADSRLPSRTPVLGISSNGEDSAFVLSGLRERAPVEIRVGGMPLVIEWDRQLDAPRLVGSADLVVTSTWQAWSQIHPATLLPPLGPESGSR